MAVHTGSSEKPESNGLPWNVGWSMVMAPRGDAETPARLSAPAMRESASVVASASRNAWRMVATNLSSAWFWLT